MVNVQTAAAATLDPVVLAYVGDAVFNLWARSTALSEMWGEPRGPAPDVQALHERADSLVSARGQALILRRIRPALTPEEESVVRRGRNCKVRHRPRSAHYAEYRQATALEVLVGYLYVLGQTDRIADLLAQSRELDTGAPSTLG